jgi:hypothetical protein
LGAQFRVRSAKRFTANSFAPTWSTSSSSHRSKLATASFKIETVKAIDDLTDPFGSPLHFAWLRFFNFISRREDWIRFVIRRQPHAASTSSFGKNTPWPHLGFLLQKRSSALELGSSRKKRRFADYTSTWTHLSNTIRLSFPEAEPDDDDAKLS